jgi:hypothetical protein
MKHSAIAIFVVLGLAACSSQADPNGTGGPVTWSTFPQPFFQHYCVSCHAPGGRATQQDFSQYSVVVANAAVIRCGVAPAGMLPSGCSGNPPAGQFPIGGGPRPSDGERLSLVGWIEAGAPQ